MTFPEDLAALAAAHGVAVDYEGSDRTVVTVDPDVVSAVLGTLGVDASTPDAVAAGLEVAAEQQASQVLPPTVVAWQGSTLTLPVQVTVEVEDGRQLAPSTELPADLPVGYHRLVADGATSTLLVAPARLPEVPRTWGWMLQLYALRSAGSWGMGDLADLAAFVRRSGEDQGAGVVLVNPLDLVAPTHPIQRSPYSPATRSFVNPLYLAITATAAFHAADAATQAEVLALAPPNDTELIDHDAVWDAKHAALELLFPLRPSQERDEPDAETLDLATFCALAELHGGDWRDWPEPLQDPAHEAVRQVRVDLAHRVAFHAWLQLLCRQQLDAARQAARDAGMAVGIVHDLPVGVSVGGPDTWSDRDAFASVVRVGCPADAFNELGQDWGLPPWRPRELAEAGYTPFRDVVRAVLEHADGIRVDHVAGLWRLWWIPPGEPAWRGTYVHYDPDAMLAVLMIEAERSGAIVVGEDLGTVEPVVTTTMRERGLLSSSVLWFERDWDTEGQPFVPPRKWEPETMASVTTHDLPTATGWLDAEHVKLRASLGLLDGPEDEALAQAHDDRDALLQLVDDLGIDATDTVAAFHAVIAQAASRLVLSAPTDVVGERRQPNLPGTVDEYPNWRIPLPVSLEEFFDDERVAAAILPLQRERP